jgi:hypothetical protein
MITLKLRDLFDGEQAIGNISNRKDLPSKAAYKIGRFYKKAVSELKDVDDARVALVKKHGYQIKNKKGEVTDDWKVKEDCGEAFEKEFLEMLDQKIELDIFPVEVEKELDKGFMMPLKDRIMLKEIIVSVPKEIQKISISHNDIFKTNKIFMRLFSSRVPIETADKFVPFIDGYYKAVKLAEDKRLDLIYNKWGVKEVEKDDKGNPKKDDKGNEVTNTKVPDDKVDEFRAEFEETISKYPLVDMPLINIDELGGEVKLSPAELSEIDFMITM